MKSAFKTRQGKEGTLYLFAIETRYRFAEGYPGETYKLWAYTAEHAAERCCDEWFEYNEGNTVDFEIVRVHKVRESPVEEMRHG